METAQGLAVEVDVFISGIIDAFRLIMSLDSQVVSSTILTLQVSGSAVILGALVGIPVALFLCFNEFYGKKAVVNLIHTFMGLPPVVVGLVVYIMLSRDGWLGGLDLLYTPAAMVIAQLVIAVPVIAGVSISAINGVDKAVSETAFSLGATKFQTMGVVLREARRGLITAIVAGFGAAISEVGAIIIVGGNIAGHTRALTTAIVLETRKGDFEVAMALGIILISLTFLVNYALTQMQYEGARR